MISHSFTFTVTSTRIVTFLAPASMQVGGNYQYSVTITDPKPGGGQTLLGIISFVQVLPASRVVTFKVPTHIAVGSHRFTCLITTLSTPAVASRVAAVDEEDEKSAKHADKAKGDTILDDVADPA